MALLDSVDKIITRYFSVVTEEPFVWKRKEYLPKPLVISPLLFRGYTCPPMCGGCCPKFSLDYLPSEKHPSSCEKRVIIFNEKKIKIFSDLQQEHSNYHCKYLNKENGRCLIHTMNPFSCDFELIRPLSFEGSKDNILTQKLFGRGWSMKRIDEKRGTLCEMTMPTEKTVDDVIRKIERLKDWSDHFRLKNKCEKILWWLKEVKPYVIRKFSAEEEILTTRIE